MYAFFFKDLLNLLGSTWCGFLLFFFFFMCLLQYIQETENETPLCSKESGFFLFIFSVALKDNRLLVAFHSPVQELFRLQKFYPVE